MKATETKPKVLLVEDHAMFRERLAHLIREDFGMTICGETDNVRDAMEMARSVKPDLALVDITLKGSSGLEFLKDLRAQEVQLPVLVLSMHEETMYAERVLAAGAKGYITKHENSQTLLHAMQHVLNGKVYLSPQMTENLLKKNERSGRESGGRQAKLTDRELEVFSVNRLRSNDPRDCRNAEPWHDHGGYVSDPDQREAGPAQRYTVAALRFALRSAGDEPQLNEIASGGIRIDA